MLCQSKIYMFYCNKLIINLYLYSETNVEFFYHHPHIYHHPHHPWNIFYLLQILIPSYGQQYTHMSDIQPKCTSMLYFINVQIIRNVNKIYVEKYICSSSPKMISRLMPLFTVNPNPTIGSWPLLKSDFSTDKQLLNKEHSHKAALQS